MGKCNLFPPVSWFYKIILQLSFASLMSKHVLSLVSFTVLVKVTTFCSLEPRPKSHVTPEALSWALGTGAASGVTQHSFCLGVLRWNLHTR